MPHIKDIPLEQWPSGWLKLQVASMLGQPQYILMTDKEKRGCGLPVTPDEMRRYIKEELGLKSLKEIIPDVD